MESFILTSKSASKQVLPDIEGSSHPQDTITSSRSAGNNLTKSLIPNLTPTQDYAIELLADFERSMTHSQIASAVGVCRRTIFDWSNRIQGWHEEIAKRVRRKKDRLFVISIHALARVMRQGEEAPVVSAARTALQYCGELKSEERAMNFNQVTNVAVGSFADTVRKRRQERGLFADRPE